MKRYVLKGIKSRKIFKKIISRKELYTFKNTYILKNLSSRKINFKKIKNRINNVNNYISKIRVKFNSLSYTHISKSEAFFKELEKDFRTLMSPKKDDFDYISEYYEIPQKYNETMIKVLAQNPNKLFVYWEISNDHISKYLNEYGDTFYELTYPILILENEKNNHRSEIIIDGFANSWYIDIIDDSSIYSVTYARKVSCNMVNLNNNSILKKDEIIHFAKSNNIVSPNGHILYNNSNNILFKNIKTNTEYTIPLTNILQSSNNIYSNISKFKEEILDNEHISSNMGNEF